MKNLDLISKRILVISLSISAVLLSASLFIFSVRPANAQSPSILSRMDDGKRYDAVVITNNTSLIWNTQTGTYKLVFHQGSNSNGSGPVIITTEDKGNLTEKFW